MDFRFRFRPYDRRRFLHGFNIAVDVDRQPWQKRCKQFTVYLLLSKVHFSDLFEGQHYLRKIYINYFVTNMKGSDVCLILLSRIDWFCLKLTPNFKDKKMKTFILGISSIWTCRILNICFDFFQLCFLVENNNRYSRFDTPNWWANKDITH